MYADLHCHPSTKVLVTNNNDLTKAPWINQEIKFPVSIDELLGDVIDSQSSLSLIRTGMGKVIFWTLYPIEFEIVNLKAFDIAIKNPRANAEFLRKLRTKSISYFDVLNMELDILKNTSNIHIINSWHDLDEEKINVIPNIEGSHAFLSLEDDKGNIDETAFLARLSAVFSQNKISYLTLTHLTNKRIFTHCYGMKLTNKNEREGVLPAYVADKGWSSLGEKIIDECVTYRVCPDVKHLSLVARRNLYQKLKDSAHPIPPIASHIGLVGTSYEDFFHNCLIDDQPFEIIKTNYYNQENYVVELKINRPKGPMNLRFNPQSINLFDEDVRSIIELGGIIGISLDQRILGANNLLSLLGNVVLNKQYNDFITLNDFILICNELGIDPEKYLGTADWEEMIARSVAAAESKDEFIELSDEEEAKELVEEEKAFEWKKKHARRVAQTILHILNVGREVSDTPWKHIVLGSDFDGIIDAVNCCKTAAEIPLLRAMLVDEFSRLKRLGKYPFQPEPNALIDMVLGENLIAFYQNLETNHG